MFKSLIISSLRSLLRHKSTNFINILGLAGGMFVLLLVIIWSDYNSTFDSQFPERDHIYRVAVNRGNQGELTTSMTVTREIIDEARDTQSEIKNATTFISSWRWPSEMCFKSDSNADCQYMNGIYSDNSFFKVFSNQILRGSDEPFSEPMSIALSESLAAKLFPGKDAIGESYRLDNWLEVKVTAIYKDLPVASNFRHTFIGSYDVLARLWGQKPENLDAFEVNAYLLLESPAKMSAVQEALPKLSTAKNHQLVSSVLIPLADENLIDSFSNGVPVGGLGTYLWIFKAFGLFIMLISAVNFVNLSTAGATARIKEVAIRKLAGASSIHLSFQLMAGAFIKVIISLLLSLLMLQTFLPSINIILEEKMVLTFTTDLVIISASMVLITVLMAGIYPTYLVSKIAVGPALKNKNSSSSAGGALRRFLTSLQIGLSIVILLVTTAVFLQVSYLRNANLGYDRHGIMILEPTYAHIKSIDAFRTELLKDPLIKAVGLSNTNLLGAGTRIEEVKWPGKTPEQLVPFIPVGLDYGLIDLLGLEFIEGATFHQSDSANSVILTETAIKQMGVKQPIGLQMDIMGQKAVVSGIVKDFHVQSLHHTLDPVILYKLNPKQAGTIYIRYDNQNTQASIAAIKREYDKLEPFFSMKYQLMDDKYLQLYANETKTGYLTAGLMTISIAIALMGIIGLATFNTVRRFREIAIRKVLGATTGNILSLLSKEFIVLSLISGIVSLPIAWYLIGIWLRNFSYSVEIPYIFYLVGLILVMFAVTLTSSLLGLKTARTNPSTVIREE